ncbi:hypothetical protein [Ralstonia pseudosolanacearum]|uniref:hypothetical protein n=1 Tax=Ralstonia pseudosolanacearum TaxID=1310165 RepID=UPI0006762FCC|nr:hypothetical protein [Ralstonia pseudosolanacearum]MDO3559429.1 hypothetical protein [Ralstonia pseudosolanacearum]MDO3579075.1 hypothetical protein [Ralstonia pseudosolanacearum]MDO3588758.1 hypothetical protein [Ralstonia pseudosolanacearum]
MSNFDIQAAVAAAAEKSADMNIAQKGGGGEYVPPAEGFTRLRFVAYVELGKTETEYQGQKKIVDEVQLVFELSGPRHEPKVLENGEKVPHRMTITVTKSLNEKAQFYKLFKMMNYKGTAKIMAQLLGEDFTGKVYHKKFKRKDGTEGVAAQLKNPDTGVFDIRPPFVEDAESGESKRVNVAPAITPLKLFLWDMPSKDMWASIFIEGQYEERKNDKGEVVAPARSKNRWQERIKAGINYAGSPIANLLSGAVDVGTDDPKEVAAKAAGKSAAAGAATAQATTASAVTAEPAESNSSTSEASDEPPFDVDGDDPLAQF